MDIKNHYVREDQEKPANRTRARYATEEAYLRALESKRRYEEKRVAKIARRRRVKRAQRLAAKEREAEFGKIVAKLNIELKMSQDEVFELLGGLVTKAEIQEWCAKARKKLVS